MNRSYHIRILGHLWLPQATAAKEETIKAGDGPFKGHIDPGNELEDLEHYISTHTGDFSSVDDYEIVCEVINSESIPNGYKEEHTFHTVRDWQDPDSEITFSDCMYPVEVEV